METHQNEKLDQLLIGLQNISPLNQATCECVKEFFTYHHFHPGQDIIECGDIVRDIHFVYSGLARYYYLTDEGKEFNKSFAPRGDVISSILSLVTQEPVPFFVNALLETETFSIPYQMFLTFTHEYRDWNHLAISLLEMLAIKKERREADFLLCSPTQRYQNFLKEFPDIEGIIPNYHIASYLGITEVALSRIRKRLGLTRVNDKTDK